ncbi:U3 small nucleolar RNA-associated protein [Punctularia strigosozonata HHB-11173 SS5]|uniref:U3 small nucleolar RNA-associated protein n=1 Tax=Punctularia strigosozonata (strain HHB-11173) TaxID=741275 RepID=UPI0004416D42|nr:U3 small nucleolar RNA-associated protein [Punctularia strigosozonata HHB-11173 SS5]EIN13890.1 U3 small nucleolar RNA-associated protein [Punctularia strigosozonata HHB-11173 SS5]
MAVPVRPKLKTAFKKARVVAPLYTGGPVAVAGDGSKLFSCVAEDVVMTDIASGTEMCRFAGDTESVTALAVSPSSNHLIMFTSSLSLRVYEVPEATADTSKPIRPVRVVSRAHDAPVHVCKVDPTSSYVASGSADGVVKVWDVRRGYTTHIFKGHGGVVSALTFSYPRDPSAVTLPKMHLITASVDTRIRIFDLSASVSRNGSFKAEHILEGHVSVPRGLDVTADGKWLVSGGRDSVVLLWDLSSLAGNSNKPKSSKAKGKEKAMVPALMKTIPALERVEAVGLLAPSEELGGTSTGTDKIRFYTGGEKGVIKIWDGQSGSVMHTFGSESELASDEEQEEQRQIVNAIYVPATSTIVSIHADQNILFHSLSTKALTRQLIGYNDEIVDATFLSASANDPSGVDSHIALATNSSLIRVYSTSQSDARLLEGHSDIVLSLDHSARGDVLASGSKDRTARLWRPAQYNREKAGEWGWRCVAICEGHAESVGAVALPRKSDEERPRFLFTGSQDRTIKMWDLLPLGPDTMTEDALKCKSLTTHKAHDKDINSLDVAPNDRFLASGSQDKTAKVFEIDYVVTGTGSVRGEIRLVGTCKGHKRGVWTVRFGRAERVLATGSGDKTVRLWSLEDFSCVKTFEGHTNSVLRVDFLNAGMQMVSAASDGLVKIWNVREEECTVTLDNHEDKVWALAVSRDERTIVSGAADSVVTFWEDSTEEEEEEKEKKRADMVLKEQDFLNYVSLHDYRNAISLALAMEQPGRLLNLFKQLRSNREDDSDMVPPTDCITGHPTVDEVIRTMHGSELTKLLKYVRDWNTHAKTSAVAQGVLFAVVKLRSAEDIMGAFTAGGVGDLLSDKAGAGSTALKELIDALIPYTERHLARMERLVQESYVVDYLLSEMDDGMFDEVGAEEESDGMDVDDGEWEGIAA